MTPADQDQELPWHHSCDHRCRPPWHVDTLEADADLDVDGIRALLEAEWAVLDLTVTPTDTTSRPGRRDYIVIWRAKQLMQFRLGPEHPDDQAHPLTDDEIDRLETELLRRAPASAAAVAPGSRSQDEGGVPIAWLQVTMSRTQGAETLIRSALAAINRADLEIVRLR